jgi:hypothetical protein
MYKINVYKPFLEKYWVRKQKLMNVNKLSPTFFPNSHKRICEFGLSGQRHCRDISDLDVLQALSGRRLYFMYVGGRKVKQTAKDGYSNNASDRPRAKPEKAMNIKQHKKTITFDNTYHKIKRTIWARYIL